MNRQDLNRIRLLLNCGGKGGKPGVCPTGERPSGKAATRLHPHEVKSLKTDLKGIGKLDEVHDGYGKHIVKVRGHSNEMSVASVLKTRGWKEQQHDVAYGGYSGTKIMTKGDLEANISGWMNRVSMTIRPRAKPRPE